MREHASKMYGTGIYYASKLCLELPLLLLMPVFENMMTFWGIGYRAEAFLKFSLVYVLTVQVGTSMGYFISCLFDNMISASQVTPFAVMPSVLFGGFLVNVGQLGSWISWFQYTSPTRFGLEALCWAQWPDDELGVQKLFSFDLGFWVSCYWLAMLALFFRFLTLFFFNRLVNRTS